MKKHTKFTLGGIALLFGALVLSGCTQSFVSKKDKAHMLYAFDFGVCDYYSNTDSKYDPSTSKLLTIDGVDTDIYYSASLDNNSYLTYLHTQADSSGLAKPTLDYYVAMDTVVLKHAFEKENITILGATVDNALEALDKYGYLKYYNEETDEDVWDNFYQYLEETKEMVDNPNDDCPRTDFLKLYKTNLTSKTSSYRASIAIKTGKYGYYGYGSGKKQIEIEGKDFTYAWKNMNFPIFEGLLVWPIGALIDLFVESFSGMGLSTTNGIPQFIAILLVTLIVRGLMMVFTIKQTTANAKMTSLQPEIAKLQEKYPSPNDKQILAQKTSELYKKHGINPLSTILVMFIQFPVFICVWGALQGNAWLSTGSFLGLNLNATIQETLFNASAWAPGGGAVTALILFLLMSGSQVVSMLLPQWIQKAKTKKVARLGVNQQKKEQDNKMKWFTYIMMAMIIFMGFSLASAMGVYWFVGALISIIQTLITQKLTDKKKGK